MKYTVKGETFRADDADWEVTWTEDGDLWESKLFEHLNDAREFANGLFSENESNKEFKFYARRFVTVNTCDFLDNAFCAVQVRISDRHSER